MPTLNLSVFLNSYQDAVSNNAPSMNNFRWNRDLTALTVNNPLSQTIQLAASETRVIFTSVNKKFIYMESDKAVAMTINGVANAGAIAPFVIGSSIFPGVFMQSAPLTALTIINQDSSNSANVLIIATE